jgi:hypothetical protein
MNKSKAMLGTAAIVGPLAFVLYAKIVKGSEPPGRLVDNGDGTVTDIVTKLTWQQATTPSTYTQTNGANYCSALNLGAFSSAWRLPSVKELISIVDYESPTAPAIDTVAFPGTQNNWYLTSAPSIAGGGVLINFTDGSMTNGGGGYNVRCVHAGLGGADGVP